MTPDPTGIVLHHGGYPHACTPGWESQWYDGDDDDDPTTSGPPAGNYMHDLFLPPGSVWECTCGQVWVCYRPNTVYRGFVECNPRAWRKEKRRERRRRERRAS